MFGFKRLDRHADLVTRMGDAVGVDIVEQVQRGAVSENQLAGMVTRCVGCTEAQSCEQWLQANPRGAETTPGYCRNKDLFAMLGK